MLDRLMLMAGAALLAGTISPLAAENSLDASAAATNPARPPCCVITSAAEATLTLDEIRDALSGAEPVVAGHEGHDHDAASAAAPPPSARPGGGE
jgi:hypothetical protein